MKRPASSERRVDYLPLKGIKGAERNPKDHDIGELSRSVGRFGYVEPVILDERTERLVSGHGRIETLRALQAQGAAPPDGVRKDSRGWLVPVLRGWASRSDQEAEAFLLASNRLVELGGWKDAELSEMLAGLAKAGALDGVGWSPEDVDDLLGAAAGVPEVPLPDLPSGDKSPIGQMTFVLSTQQVSDIEAAIAAAIERGAPGDGVNENSRGNALWLIAKGFTGG